MSHHPIIQVEGLSKCYRLGVIGRETLAEEFRYWWLKASGRRPADHMGAVTEPAHAAASTRLATQMVPDRPGWFWALHDVSFSVEPGEVLGVIGSNGAGKSTLLKILARITEPTHGRARITGRLSSLLEVGTGFHPELTGGENVYINGAILGMTEQEIRRKFDAIVDFADMADFIDTPVKRYSSGMRTRLAFAVAAHLEPDVLLVDEVLSVGDAEFQRKCAGKMEQLASHGRTVLFVSHRLASVAQMCKRSIWIDHGRLHHDGPTDDVIEAYLSSVTANGGEVRWDEGMTSPRLDGLTVYHIRLCNHRGEVSAAWLDAQPFFIEVDYQLARDMADFRLGFEVNITGGAPMFVSLQEPIDPALGRAGRHRVRTEVPAGLILPGRRQVAVLADLPGKNQPLRVGLPLSFDIEASTINRTHRGLVNLPTPWHVLTRNGAMP